MWEVAIDMLGGAGYDDAELEARYLDEEARAALAKGKEQLAEARAGIVAEEHIEKKISLTAPVHTSTSTDVDIVGSSSHFSSPAKTVEAKPVTTESPLTHIEE